MPTAFIQAQKWLCIMYLHGRGTGMTAAQTLWCKGLSHHFGCLQYVCTHDHWLCPTTPKSFKYTYSTAYSHEEKTLKHLLQQQNCIFFLLWHTSSTVSGNKTRHARFKRSSVILHRILDNSSRETISFNESSMVIQIMSMVSSCLMIIHGKMAEMCLWR